MNTVELVKNIRFALKLRIIEITVSGIYLINVKVPVVFGVPFHSLSIGEPSG